MASKVSRVIETLFRIYDKDGELVDFKLNSIQRKVDIEVIEPIEKFRELYGTETPIPEKYQQALRSSILKYRQGGITTLIMAWFLVECMNRYAVCVMLAHDQDHTEKLLYRAKLMLKHLKGPAPKTNKLNDNEISFAKTDSIFYIGTAGSKEFGRSACITFLHCSEIAFWKDPGRLMKSLFQAIPKNTGVIIHETTANGWGNWYQKSFYNYLIGIGGFQGLFYPWFMHDDYLGIGTWTREWDWEDATEFEVGKEKIRVPNEKIVFKRMLKFCKENNTKPWPRELILKKLQWRREKIQENIGDKDFIDALRDFKQEYPSTYEEAFIMSGGSLFGNVRAKLSKLWVRSSAHSFRLVSHPRPNLEYVIGGDFSGGTGNDNASIHVFCVETKEQVYHFADNHTDPIEFAELLCTVGKEYNNAYMVFERNNHGLSGSTIIKRSYDISRVYKCVLAKNFTSAQMNIPTITYGWQTTGINKPYMVGIAQQFLKAGWIIYDPATESELRAFVEDPLTGKLGGQGEKDDRAMSLFLTFIGILKVLRLKGIFIQDYDGTEETYEIPFIPESTVVVIPKEIENKQPSWRNTRGELLIPFSDMFGNKKRKR